MRPRLKKKKKKKKKAYKTTTHASTIKIDVFIARGVIFFFRPTLLVGIYKGRGKSKKYLYGISEKKNHHDITRNVTNIKLNWLDYFKVYFCLFVSTSKSRLLNKSHVFFLYILKDIYIYIYMRKKERKKEKDKTLALTVTNV